MAKFVALPLFTDAYLADAGHLSEAEHGRYLLMLIHMWRAPGCHLPNDDEWLARKFKRSVDDIRSEYRPLIREFFKVDGRWLYQKRLRKEKNYVAEKRRKSSIAAKVRWDKEKGICERNAPTPSPSPIKKKEERKKESIDRGASRPAGNEEFEQFWLEYPKRDGANPKAPARKAFSTASRHVSNPAVIVAGAKAYAHDPTTKVGTPYVVQATRWLHERRWEDYAEKLAEQAAREKRKAEYEAQAERENVYWLNKIAEEKRNVETN